MRVFLVAIFLVLFSIISLPLYLIAFILGKIDEKKKVAFAQKVVKIVFWWITILAGVRLDCKGAEKLPKDEPFMYIANHRSYYDILAGYLTVPTLTGFVSKDDLKRVPCISHWMRILKCLFLNRDNPREGMKTILQGVEQIKEGYSVFIMPEGTRNKSDELLPFHDGSFKLSTKTGCAIVPVAMKNTDLVVRHHFAWFHPTKVTVVYGEPVYPSQLTSEEKKSIGTYMRGKMQEMLDNME